MEKIVIEGGHTLAGSCSADGMKNSAVAVLMACIVTGSECIIENVPEIEDIRSCEEILQYLGARISPVDRTTVAVDTTDVVPKAVPAAMMKRLRASYYLAGALLARFGYFSIAYPGGCNIGKRPVDQHIKAFRTMGAEAELEEDTFSGKMTFPVCEADILFDVSTVGGTVNAMIAASLGKGSVHLHGAAREPYITDIQNFLNACGADIRGAGTGEIVICRKSKMHGCCYRIMPDYIEAGTFIAAAAVTRSCIRVCNAEVSALAPVLNVFSKMGMLFVSGKDVLTVDGRPSLHNLDIETGPYPGFPTDLQPMAAAMMCFGKGNGSIHENVFENRFRYGKELQKMGADAGIDGNVLKITGPHVLHGAVLEATDLRAGACLVIASLGAEGKSEVHEIHHIFRGYPDFLKKLKNLGAAIEYSN